MSLANNTTANTFQPLYSPRPIQFSILLVLWAMSIPCFIFILYYFLTSRILYQALHRHVIIALLINGFFHNLTNVPLSLSYYLTGVILPASVIYCYFLQLIGNYCFLVTNLLLTWASIERHIFIFNFNFYHSTFRRIAYHYLPISFCCIYPFVYYAGFLFFYPCNNYYNYNTGRCAIFCFMRASPIFAAYEQTMHGFVLAYTIYLAGILLIIRIYRQKQTVGIGNTWTRNRKMTVQIICISSVAFVTGIGYYTIQLVQLIWDPNFGKDAAAWFNPLTFCMPPLIPYVCLYSLPNVKEKLQAIIYCYRRVQILPLPTN